tara:strand:- start:3768 stop:4289 length:522 start_codon:yes stop_codon:yes gene_type:complete
MKGLRDYLKEAQGIIVKWGPVGLLYDDECIGYVAGKMMEADWRYDATKGASPTTWRITCGRWAIYNWIRQKKNYAKKAPISLNAVGSSEGAEIWETLEDHRNVSNKRLDVDYKKHISILSKIQKEYVVKHFEEGISMTDIANEKGVSRQAVSISIKGAVEKIRNALTKDRIEK